MSRRKNIRKVNPREGKLRRMAHMAYRAAVIHGRMDDLYRRMKRAGKPEEDCREASLIRELSDYLVRYEEEIAEAYCELEGSR